MLVGWPEPEGDRGGYAGGEHVIAVPAAVVASRVYGWESEAQARATQRVPTSLR